MVYRPRQVIKKFNFVYIFINFSCTPPLEISPWLAVEGLKLGFEFACLTESSASTIYLSSVFNKHGEIRSRRCWHSNLLSTKSHYSLLLRDIRRSPPTCGSKEGWRKRRRRWQITSESFLITAAIWFWQLLSFVPHLFTEWGSDCELCRRQATEI